MNNNLNENIKEMNSVSSYPFIILINQGYLHPDNNNSLDCFKNHSFKIQKCPMLNRNNIFYNNEQLDFKKMNNSCQEKINQNCLEFKKLKKNFRYTLNFFNK